jgi:alpha-galactosidase
MIKHALRRLTRLSLLSLLFFWLLSAEKTYASTVTISQSGTVVTATNGMLTLTYDLSTGKGNFNAGSTSLISGFYSDYGVSGSATRISSYDSGTRTASWVSIGTDGYGASGEKLTITNSLASGSTIVLYLTLYSDKPFVLARMAVNNATSQTLNFLEPIAARNLDIGTGSDKRIYTTPYNNNYDFGVAPVNDFGNSENQVDRTSTTQTTWGPFDGTSFWVAAMFDNTSKQGFIAGAATTVNWKSYQYLAPATTANGPLTGFSVFNSGGTQSGTSVSSDLFFLGYYSDYRSGLTQFGTTYSVGQPKLAWAGGVPLGYNDYYTFYAAPTVTAMNSMTDYFVAHLKSLGYTYMNLDCCYKGTSPATTGDYTAYTNYVHSKGMKAGSYSAPFEIFDPLTNPVPGASSYTFQDIVLKDSNNNVILSYLSKPIVDTTHPGAQAYLQYLMNTYYVNTGMDYVKLDYLDLAMYEGQHHDPTKNGMQAYRIGMQVIRDTLLGASRPIYIDESIAPLLPSGYAHGRRTGVDLTIPLQSSLYNGVERQAMNAAASWWTNGTLYVNDPDMAIPENISNGFSKFSGSYGRLNTTSDFLSGGELLIGDNTPFIAPDRISPFLDPNFVALAQQGIAAKPASMTNFYHKLEHSPSPIYLTRTNGDVIVGLSNWDTNNTATQTVTFSALGLSPSTTYTITELYSSTALGTFSGSYSRSLAPGESIILKISTTASSLPTPPTNLALGQAASAFSIWGAGFEASKATDGNVTTRWSAANSPYNNQWLEIDFSVPTSVNRVVIREYGNGTQVFQIQNYSLQYWNGTSYASISNGFTLTDFKTIDFPTVNTSKLRLVATTADFIPSITEMEAYNVSGNTGSVIDQDDSSTGTYSAYSDIRAGVERMQTFRITQSSLPKIDFYLYESYVNSVPKDNYYIDIVLLDSNYNPVSTLFTAALASNNIPGAPSAYSIYPRLTGLDTTKNYGIVLRSPATIDDGSTNNKYGFAYNDSNPYANGFERLSTDGGTTWTTENSGSRDLIFTLYK